MKEKKNLNNTNTNNDENDISNNEQQELYSGLNTINLSILGILLIIYGVLINTIYLFWQRAVILDQINDTEFTKNMQDLGESPRKANLLYLIATTIFVAVIWKQYNETVSDRNSTNIDIEKQSKTLTAILLYLLAASINYDVLNNSRYNT